MFYKGEIPFVRLLLPLIAGILCGYLFSSKGLYDSVIAIAIISFLALAFMITQYKRFSVFRIKWVAGVVTHCFLLALGCWSTIFTSDKFDTKHYSLQTADAFVAEIRNEPNHSGKILRFEAEIIECLNEEENENKISTGKIIISLQVDSLKRLGLEYGDRLLLPAVFNDIEPPYNPGEFNYKSYLANHQIYYQVFLKQDQVCLIGKGNGNTFVAFALDLRKDLVNKFYRYLPDKDAAAFASTLILGYKAELSRELIKAYSKTGTMHVLSVSGMHVGIVFMVLSVLLKFMDKTSGTRLIRAILIISIIWFYALLTGFSAPACRAALMLSFIVLGKALNKHQNTYNLIAISAFSLLLYNPSYLVDAGFQLSYLAVTGLVYAHPKIYQSVYIRHKLPDYIWSYSALSIAAQLATFPFSIYYFHQFPVYFLFSNLFIVLPVAIIMYGGISFMFIPFPAVLNYLGQILSSLIMFTNDILYYIENLPYSSWDGIWINTEECVLICLTIVLICVRLSSGYKATIFPIAIFLILLSSSVSWNWIKNNSRHQILFYNLRKNSGIAYLAQGRSIVITDVDTFDKQIDFSLLPAVRSLGSSSVKIYNNSDVFTGIDYFGDQNYYQFGAYRLMLWNKNLDNADFSKKLSVDAVLITGNPRITIKGIASHIDFERIIIDSNNPDYKIDKWVVEANELNQSFYVLKKNPALIVNL